MCLALRCLVKWQRVLVPRLGAKGGEAAVTLQSRTGCYWAWKMWMLIRQNRSRRDKEYPVEACRVELKWNLNSIICLWQEKIWDGKAVTGELLAKGYNQSRIAFFSNGWLGPDLVIYFYHHIFLHVQWNARIITEIENNFCWKGSLEIPGPISLPEQGQFQNCAHLLTALMFTLQTFLLNLWWGLLNEQSKLSSQGLLQVSRAGTDPGKLNLVLCEGLTHKTHPASAPLLRICN